MRQRLARPCRLHLPFAAIFADVAGLRKIGVTLARFARDFLAVRPELAGRFPILGSHIQSWCEIVLVTKKRGRAVSPDCWPATRFAANAVTTL
jgi:hypothetical protein